MGVETTKKKLQTFGDINLLGTIWKTRYENRLQIIMSQILPPLYSETFKLQTTMVM